MKALSPSSAAQPQPSDRRLRGSAPVLKVLGPPAPRVAFAGGWTDPADPRAGQGVPYSLAAALARIGVYAGYREVIPPTSVLRLVQCWAALPGRRRATGAWQLGPEMRLVWAASDAMRRLRTPRSVDGWVLTGAVRAVRGPFVFVTDQSPHQFFHRPVLPSWSEWSPRATPRQLAARERRTVKIYRTAQACCAASRWAAESLINDDGIDPRRVRVVGMGPGPGYEQPSADVLTQRDWATPRFLFVGSDWERKNGDAVVRALTRLRASAPSATLDVVGRHPALSVDGVTAHGTLSRWNKEQHAKLKGLFARATCLVMPSRVEPFGHVYVEAAAAGVPSIGTSVGGAADAIGPGGILVDPSDDEALVDAMGRMCDPATAVSFGMAARKHADRLTWDVVAQRVIRALGLAVPGVELADYL